jgi:hypothetical protein
MQVMEVTGVSKGPRVGTWAARVWEFKILHPTASAADCVAWLRKEAAAARNEQLM